MFCLVMNYSRNKYLMHEGGRWYEWWKCGTTCHIRGFFLGCPEVGIHSILYGISRMLAQVGGSSWMSLRELMKSILILFIFPPEERELMTGTDGAAVSRTCCRHSTLVAVVLRGLLTLPTPYFRAHIYFYVIFFFSVYVFFKISKSSYFSFVDYYVM